MKKSALGTLIASLFTVAIFGSTLAKAGDGEHADEERKMIKIEMKHQNEGPVNIEVDIDGNQQVFEFTQKELSDQNAIEAKLVGVDEKTRQTLLETLSNINAGAGHIVIKHGGKHNNEHDGKMMKKQFVIVDGQAGIEREMIIELAKSGDLNALHEMVETHTDIDIDGEENAMVFKFGHDGNIKFHSDSTHALKVIKSLIETGDLTPEQLDQVQQALDLQR